MVAGERNVVTRRRATCICDEAIAVLEPTVTRTPNAPDKTATRIAIASAIKTFPERRKRRPALHEVPIGTNRVIICCERSKILKSVELH